MRKLISRDPYSLPDPRTPGPHQRWPAKWVHHPDDPKPPFVMAYRRKFVLAGQQTIDIHVSADERYDLWIDGQRIGRGPERGDPKNWYFETYTLDLKGGEHVIVARVWSQGEIAPMAQMSFRPGFLLSPDKDFVKSLATGAAAWEVKPLRGFNFTHTGQWLMWVGPQNRLDGAAIEWGWERGEGEGWKPVALGEPGLDAERADAFEYDATHHLRPAMLPPQIEQTATMGVVRWAGDVSSWDTHLIPVREQAIDGGQKAQWKALVTSEEPLTVPPHAQRRVIFDLGDYFCAYPQLELSGGDDDGKSLVRIFWAESLFPPPDHPNGQSNKGNRDEVEGRLFSGQGDEFRAAGSDAKRAFEPLWWRSGRYVEVYVETHEKPLTIHALKLIENRYPLQVESEIKSGDERFDKVVPIMQRALMMCSHETYMDCPYYEQLMYEGDTRLEALATYVTTADARLPRKAVMTFARSRLASGLTQSRFPSRQTQIIPPFSLWWIAMLHDFALWRGELPMIKSLMPIVRGVIDSYLTNINDAGLLAAPLGWNYYDWVGGWGGGIPPDGEFGVSGVANWHLVYTLGRMKELETWCGEIELAARADRLAKALAAKASAKFWDEHRMLFADDLAHQKFSEHAQSLAILSNYADADHVKRAGEALLKDQSLTRTTIYFTHYLFETFRVLNRTDRLLERMDLWYDLPKRGLKTTPESPEPARSDCHAWGAHPLYHYFATLLGIRPAGVGFSSVKIEPRLGPMKKAAGKLPHPLGMIEIELKGDADHLRGGLTLPKGLSGTLEFGGKVVEVGPGRQEVNL